MNSFIDTLGRLTAEQAERIQEEAEKHALEERRLAAAEMNRLEQEYAQQAEVFARHEHAVSRR